MSPSEHDPPIKLALTLPTPKAKHLGNLVAHMYEFVEFVDFDMKTKAISLVMYCLFKEICF